MLNLAHSTIQKTRNRFIFVKWTSEVCEVQSQSSDYTPSSTTALCMTTRSQRTCWLDENENESSCQYPVRAGMHPAVEHQYQADQAANMARGRGSGGSGGLRKLLQGLDSGIKTIRARKGLSDTKIIHALEQCTNIDCRSWIDWMFRWELHPLHL